MIKKKIHTLLIAIACLFLMQVTVTVSADDSTLQTESTTDTTQEQSEDNETQSDFKKTESPIIDTENNNKEKDVSEETTDSENNDTDPEEKSFSDSNIRYFDDPIFKRNLTGEGSFSLLFINDEFVALTEKEFEEYENKLSSIDDEKELNIEMVRSLLKEIISRSETDYVPVMGASLRASNHFDWNNWQNESQAGGQPLATTHPIKTNKVRKWHNTNRFRLTVGKVGETKPVINIKRNSIHVVNATNISNPDITIKRIAGSTPTATYYNWDRSERGPNATSAGNTVMGRYQYVRRDFKGYRQYIDMKFPGNKELNIQPSVPTTVEFIYDIAYNTPAINGFNNNMNQPINQTLASIIYPQVVKSIHIDKKTGKVLNKVETHKRNGYYLDPIEIAKKDFSGYDYSHYEVLEEKQLKERSEDNVWKGKLNQRKRAIVFYYDAKPQTYQVEFETNGGSKINSQTVEEGSKAKKPSPDPTFDNKRFKGWYIDEKLTTPYDFNKPVNSNLILYAKWESPIVNPEDGDTPIIPLDPENQNKTKDGLRIQYVSDFEFGEKKNEFRKEISGHAAGDIVKQNSKEKTVPAFVSVIDDRTLHSNEYQWELRAKSEPFKDTKDETTIDNASILLSDLNYARNLNKKPYAANNTLNISADSQLLSHNGDTKGGTWSLAFGQLENGKSTGVTIKIPAATAKKNVDYYAIINWELTPSLGGR